MAGKVEDYIAGLSGWQRDVVVALRQSILLAGGVEEVLKWGHPVYLAGGPVCLVKAFPGHVTLGFWRGADMRDLDDRLAPHGRYDMASFRLTGPRQLNDAEIAALVARGIALNREKGDPTKEAGTR